MNLTSKIYILEGPDGSGKTYLANKLAELYKIPVYHLTYYKDKDQHKAQFEKINSLIEKGTPMIVDRYIMSDEVYGEVYRNGECIEDYDKFVCNLMNNPNVEIIFAIPQDKEKYIQEFARLKGEREEMYTDKMDKVYDSYLEMYGQIKTVIRFSKKPFPKVHRYDRFEYEQTTAPETINL